MADQRHDARDDEEPRSPIEWRSFPPEVAEWAYTMIVVLTFFELRSMRLTPQMLLPIDENARWEGAVRDASPPARVVRRWWFDVVAVVARQPSDHCSPPKFTAHFYELTNEVFAAVFVPRRALAHIRAIEANPTKFPAYLRTSVRHQLYDMVRVNDPRTYNLYNNLRVALSLAWVVYKTLRCVEESVAPVLPVGHFVRGEVILERTFTAATDNSARGLTLSRDALVARMNDGVRVAPGDLDVLQAKLCHDSEHAIRVLARLLAGLLGCDCAQGVVLRDAMIAWIDEREPTARRASKVSLDAPDAPVMLAGACDDLEVLLKVKFGELKLFIRNAHEREAFLFLMQRLIKTGRIPTVSELHRRLHAREYRVARSTAGVIHLRFTRALGRGAAVARQPPARRDRA